MNSCEQFSQTRRGKRKWKLPHNRASRRKFVWQENVSKISSRWSKQENVFILPKLVVVLKRIIKSYGWWRWDWVRLEWDKNWMLSKRHEMSDTEWEFVEIGWGGNVFCVDEQKEVERLNWWLVECAASRCEYEKEFHRLIEFVLYLESVSGVWWLCFTRAWNV
jgi:hypothetical protein